MNNIATFVVRHYKRKEPILVFFPKNYEKKNWGSKGLNKIKIYIYV